MNKLLAILLLTFSVLPIIGQSAPGLAPLVSPPVTAGTASGATYYVDNTFGSDSNSGTSPSTPWKTIAHVNAATIASGSQVLFLSTDVWHEQLSTSAGVTYSWYGPAPDCNLRVSVAANCKNMPIIDGSDAVTGWSVQSGANYKAAYTSTASKGFVDSLYQPQNTPLVLTTSIALVTSTTGSIFSDGTNVYVHLFDGSNPANHAIEVAGARISGVSVGNTANVTIDGLEIIRATKGGVYNNTTSPSGLTVRNSVFFNVGDTSNGNFMGAVYQGGVGFTGYTVSNNYFGVMDFPDSQLANAQGAISWVGTASATNTIKGNYFAPIHGAAVALVDGFSGTCSGGLVTNNEITNSEGAVYISGCSAITVSNNYIHDAAGNGIEVTTGIQSTTPTGEILQANRIINMLPGYGNTLFNCIDINPSTGGYAIDNVVAKCAAADMTLEGSSTGWTVSGNLFDATNNTSSTGGTVTSSTPAYPMLVISTSLSGVTFRSNNFLFNPNYSVIRFNATSGTDNTHDYSQAVFDGLYPGYEIQGPSMNAALMNDDMVAVVASATTITPTTPLVEISGTTPIATITLPSGFTSGCFDILATGAWTTTTAGNIQATMTASANTPYRACYWPAITKWTIK